MTCKESSRLALYFILSVVSTTEGMKDLFAVLAKLEEIARMILVTINA
ncbi:Uncharacterised protein [Streptococcus pneumoniae]|nr:Uncharacterised protein [Streptococcus pneumoniae]